MEETPLNHPDHRTCKERCKEPSNSEHTSKCSEWIPLRVDNLSTYLRTRAANTVQMLSFLLQDAGFLKHTADFAVYPVIAILLLLMPLILCLLGLSATVFLFSLCFLTSAVLSGLACATTFLTFTLFLSLLMVATLTAVTLSATALTFVALVSLSLLVLPIIPASRILRSAMARSATQDVVTVSRAEITSQQDEASSTPRE